MARMNVVAHNDTTVLEGSDLAFHLVDQDCVWFGSDEPYEQQELQRRGCYRDGRHSAEYWEGRGPTREDTLRG